MWLIFLLQLKLIQGHFVLMILPLKLNYIDFNRK